MVLRTHATWPKCSMDAVCRGLADMTTQEATSVAAPPAQDSSVPSQSSQQVAPDESDAAIAQAFREAFDQVGSARWKYVRGWIKTRAKQIDRETVSDSETLQQAQPQSSAPVVSEEDIDRMRDVYMTRHQLAAFDRILNAAQHKE